MTTDVIRATDPLRVGFIGAGFMATVHSRAARAARARLVAVAASTPTTALAAAETLGFESAAADADELIATPLDAVHVVTPNISHADFALAAIGAGRHVICEKPLATSVEDARRLVDAAESAGVVAAVPFVYRYHPMVREARARIARGDAGRVLSIRGSYLQDWLATESDDDWRVDHLLGGPSRAFADIGSHLCDLVEFVSGDRIVRLAATTRTFLTDRASNHAIGTEDAAAVIVETAGGAIGSLLVSQMAPGRKNRLTFDIAGSAESLSFNQEQPDSLWLGRRARSELVAREAEQLTPDAARLSVVPAGHPMGYQDAFNAFVADAYAVMGGAEREGLPTFADGLRAAVLTDAVLRSSADAAWVDVPALAPAAAAVPIGVGA